jgi:succinoglycan biosynthesis protein ExoA
VGRAIAAALTNRLATGGVAYRHPDLVNRAIDVDTVPFGCFKKGLWLLVGGYDERHTVNEDYVLNYRARLAGRRVVLDPSIRATYYARGTLRDLARQYFRYGWVKSGMLRHYPGAIRWRQVVPAGFAAMLVSLTLLSLVDGGARPWLAAVVIVYVAAVFAAAVAVSVQTRQWWLVPLYGVTLAIVQLAWGVGALVNTGTFGRWPVWTKARHA